MEKITRKRIGIMEIWNDEMLGISNPHYSIIPTLQYSIL
jgi:hypothetical protein